MKNLSRIQLEVMKWLGKNWHAEPSYGEFWTINGGIDRLGVTCTTRTLKALEARSLITMDDNGCWVATDTGKALVDELAM